jgi:hypothetical protein
MSQKHARILVKVLEKYDLLYEIHEFGEGFRFIEYTISENDELFPVFENLIQKHQLYVQTGVYYDDTDFLEADWFTINAGEDQYPQPEDRFIEATYDLTNYCGRCGFGKEQTKPFRLKSDFKQENLDFLGLHWVHDEFFVRKKCKSILDDEGVSDITFLNPVFHSSDLQIQDLFQVKTKMLTESGVVVNGLDKRVCAPHKPERPRQKKKHGAFGIGGFREDLPYCGHTNYLYPRRSPLKFHRKTMENRPDIIRSKELFGDGVGHHLILASKRFFNIVQEYELTGLRFTPIELV